jgi:hypothetical protein
MKSIPTTKPTRFFFRNWEENQPVKKSDKNSDFLSKKSKNWRKSFLEMSP